MKIVIDIPKDVIESAKSSPNYYPTYHFEKIWRAIANGTPHQKTGRWIFVDKAHEHAHCSKCDYGDVDLMDGRPHNYCPNCGAKMIEPQESEDKDADKKCTYKETGCGSCKRQLDCPIEADMAESEPQERSGEK